jgi:hypothetical protein
VLSSSGRTPPLPKSRSELYSLALQTTIMRSVRLSDYRNETSEYVYDIQLEDGTKRKNVDVEKNLGKSGEHFRIAGVPEHATSPLGKGTLIEKEETSNVWTKDCVILRSRTREAGFLEEFTSERPPLDRWRRVISRSTKEAGLMITSRASRIRMMLERISCSNHLQQVKRSSISHSLLPLLYASCNLSPFALLLPSSV